ncbi:hypothetical protein KY290_035776 [Solanum tuberosum]|uniref:RNase H type-1 domain-containing protein n=1 Tax=Solanum tuberosum TaxID=4113 RepID=A0ABQ7TSF8_SOLTU|nr:hypothetical protein KY290_035776 [Solanum tuberosum]
MGKEITSSHYTSIEKTKESKEGKTPQRASVFERIGRLTPRVSTFERLSCKDERGSSKQVDEYATTSKTFVFHRLGTKRKSLSERRLLEHENQDSCDITDDKEIHSVFPSCMKRKTVLSITTDGSLKVKISTIVVTNQFHGETNKEEDETVTVENDDIQEAPPQLEDGVQSTVDDLKELNLGILEDPRPIFISALLTPEEKRKYFKLLSQRVFRPELVTQIETEVNKLIEAGFIREVKYPLWISNIVPVKKKNGEIRVCVDFRDLNKACPKDNFPMPIIELMVDATTGHEAMSFMDGSSGYNQIRMSPKDEEYTAFRTQKGIYCFKVMPFGLKNVEATYQRAMQNIFDDMLHKRVECYVDDLVVKTKQVEHHLEDLRIVFERLRKFDLKMNPLKCAFGVTSGKFLGFIVCHRGIEVDPAKIDAIQKMLEPKNLRDLRSLQGNLAFIRRFISNLAGRCQPFNHLMKKDAFFHWDQSCRNAFESIKRYLMNSPVLGAQTLGKPLILYIASQERSLGAFLAQENEAKKEQALYYLSRTLIGAELNYTPIEKMCLALLYAAVKGQTLANFLADHPLPGKWETSDEFPDEDAFLTEELPAWTMFFDGSVRRDGAGAGVVLISPEQLILTFSFVLGETYSNNAAEYQDLIVGLEMALDMKIPQLDVYADS